MQKVVLLDFDGTLADSSEGIYGSFKVACDANTLPPPELSDFLPQIGATVGLLFDRFFGGFGVPCRELFIASFREHYDSVGFRQLSWYSGVEELIASCLSGGATVGIVTNKPTLPTRLLVADQGLQIDPENILGIDGGLQVLTRPFISKGEALRYLTSLRGWTPLNCMYVGDTPSDLRAAREVSIRFVAATYGFHAWSTDELEDSDVATDLASLTDVVRIWRANSK